MKFRQVFFILMLSSFSLVSQGSDSAVVFSLHEFYKLVLAYHPLARQANTLPAEAKSELRMVRGAFDPEFKGFFDEKRLDGSNYWSVWQSRLTVPLWSGTDIKVAYDKATGKELDASLLTPDGGLSYVGITIPLGQGLLIDQRRAALRQAQLALEAADAQKVVYINKLLLQVAKDYWDWFFTYERLSMHEESLRLAGVRFNAVRDRVLLGDLPALDSLEAFIEVQNRLNVLNQSRLEYNNARLIASNHLWNDRGEPVMFDTALVPAILSEDLEMVTAEEMATLMISAGEHPELVGMNVKIGQLDIERRWAAEKLRPKLNFDYNFLRPGRYPWVNTEQPWRTDDNFKYGLQFSVPLFLRQERGKLGLVRIKRSQADFERQQLSREIRTRIEVSRNEMSALQEQIRIQEEQVRNAERMLQGEQFRFDSGEGSVFLMNTRENALINSRIKLEELKSKFGKSRALLYWSAGNLAGAMND